MNFNLYFPYRSQAKSTGCPKKSCDKIFLYFFTHNFGCISLPETLLMSMERWDQCAYFEYNCILQLSLGAELSLDGSHELEVLLVPLISHCKPVSLLRSKLLSRHGLWLSEKMAFIVIMLLYSKLFGCLCFGLKTSNIFQKEIFSIRNIFEWKHSYSYWNTN